MINNSLFMIKKKNLVINLPKKAKDLYSEIQKILMKEIKGDKKTDGDIYHVLGLEERML